MTDMEKKPTAAEEPAEKPRKVPNRADMEAKRETAAQKAEAKRAEIKAKAEETKKKLSKKADEVRKQVEASRKTVEKAEKGTDAGEHETATAGENVEDGKTTGTENFSGTIVKTNEEGVKTLSDSLVEGEELANPAEEDSEK